MLVAAIGAFLAIGATWLWRIRRGQPVDIDEAGYLSIAIGDLRGWEQGGLAGWWDIVLAPSTQAPLMPATTTPVFLLAGTGVLPGLLVPLLLGGVMLLAAHGLGHEVGGRRIAWLTLAVTAAAPVVIMYSRSYNFAIASGAMAALVLWALARSRRFEHLGWSCATGVAIGLLALSRTFVIALLPALAVIALVALAAGPRRGRRLAGASLAALLAVVVAGPWYRKNGELVWDYLTSAGYGSARAEYGGEESALSLDSWRSTFQYATQWNGLPLCVLWAVGLGLVVAVGLLRWRRQGAGSAFLTALRSPVLPSIVWAGGG
jgi:4-amino-4-deoxy-L-arabinose transferase-like glycosyltransferase